MANHIIDKHTSFEQRKEAQQPTTDEDYNVGEDADEDEDDDDDGRENAKKK